MGGDAKGNEGKERVASSNPQDAPFNFCKDTCTMGCGTIYYAVWQMFVTRESGEFSMVRSIVIPKNELVISVHEMMAILDPIQTGRPLAQKLKENQP
jgi:hypothetical protein